MVWKGFPVCDPPITMQPTPHTRCVSAATDLLQLITEKRTPLTLGRMLSQASR